MNFRKLVMFKIYISLLDRANRRNRLRMKSQAPEKNFQHQPLMPGLKKVLFTYNDKRKERTLINLRKSLLTLI